MHPAITLVDANVVLHLAKGRRRQSQLLVDRLGGIFLHGRAAPAAAIEREVNPRVDPRQRQAPPRRCRESPIELIRVSGVPAKDAVLEVVEAKDLSPQVHRDVAVKGCPIAARRLGVFAGRGGKLSP